MNEPDNTTGTLPLSPGDLADYKRIAAGLPPTRSPDRLTAHQLVDNDPYHSGAHIATDPRGATHHLIAAAQADLTRAAERIAQIPALESLIAHWDPHRFYGGPSSEFLAGKTQMNARIGEVTAAATAEILAAQPGEPSDRDPEIVHLGTTRTRSALARGVQVKSLYASVAHSHSQTREYAAEIGAAGAEVRASSGPFPRMVLVDRHLFIDNLVVEGSEQNAGWHVVDRSAVMWARQVFTFFWDQATRWQDLEPTGGTVTTRRQRAMLRELDAGYSQQQVGPRIGLGERAVNKELADLRKVLGLRTMNQLMSWWGRSPERHLP